MKQKSPSNLKNEQRNNPLPNPTNSSETTIIRESIGEIPSNTPMSNPPVQVKGSQIRLDKTNNMEKKDPFRLFLGKPDITNLFVILVGVGTMISLLPIFLDFFIGPDWLNVFLKDEFGFKALLSMIIAVFCGLIFMMIILIYIIYDFLREIFFQECSTADKIYSSFFLLFGVISFFGTFFVIISVWEIKAIAQKFDIILAFSILLVIFAIAVLYSIIMYISLFIEDLKVFCQIVKTGVLNNIVYPCCLGIKNVYKQISVFFFSYIPENSRIRTIPLGLRKMITPNRKAILIAIIPIVVIGILLFLFSQILFPTYALVSNYYNDTNKSLDVTMVSENNTGMDNSPPLLNITYSSKDTFNRLGTFDYSYLECHWTTNYGYFIKMDPNSHKVDERNDMISITPCPSSGSIFWTYDVLDYGKNKPDVFISLTLQDSNKGRIFGNNHLKLNWTGSDTIIVETFNEMNKSAND